MCLFGATYLVCVCILVDVWRLSRSWREDAVLGGEKWRTTVRDRNNLPYKTLFSVDKKGNVIYFQSKTYKRLTHEDVSENITYICYKKLYPLSFLLLG